MKMILIASTLVLFMVSIGYGNPLPEPYPEPDIIIQVKQGVHQRYCKKPHDKEGPFGHPINEATAQVDDEDKEGLFGHPTTEATPVIEGVKPTPVDIEALEKELEELEANLNKAEEALNKTKEEVEKLENEVADLEADSAAVTGVTDALANIDFGFRRKRASVLENVNDILGGLDDPLDKSHRRQLAVIGSNPQTLTFCPDTVGEITETGFDLYINTLTDMAAAFKPPRDMALLKCLGGVLNDLKALAIQFTNEEIEELKFIANGAKTQAETAKQDNKAIIKGKKVQLKKTKATVEALEEYDADLKEEAAAIEAEIETAKAN